MMPGEPQKLSVENPFSSLAGGTDFSASAYAFSGLDVSKLAAGGLGTVLSPWTGWETAVNAAPAFTLFRFPLGQYLQTAIINVKAGQQFHGDGYGDNQATQTFGATFITSSIAGTSFRTNYADNTFRSMNVWKDLCLANTNGANNGSGILLAGGAFVDIDRITVEGFKYGVTNIGCTGWTITRSFFESQTKIGVWIGNGFDYTLANADIDLSAHPAALFGDVVAIRDCRFNAGAGVALVNLESQFAITIDTCKFNGGDVAVWMTAMAGCRIQSSTFEAQASHQIQLRQQRFVSGTISGFNGGVEISGNVMTALANQHPIKADVHATLHLLNNTFATSAGAPSVILGGGNIGTLISMGNDYTPNGAATLYDAPPNNFLGLDRSPSVGATTPLVIGLANGVAFAAAAGGVVRAGTATLVGGTIAVGNTTVTAKTIVQYFRKTIGGTVGNMSYTLNVGVGFTLNSSNGADTSVFDYTLVEGP